MNKNASGVVQCRPSVGESPNLISGPVDPTSIGSASVTQTGASNLNVSIRVGSRIGLVNTGSGHIFLAFASDEERILMLEDVVDRRNHKLSPQLLARFAKVREQGYEIMESQQVSSVTNLSIPIFGPLGTVIAALTCPYTDRLDKSDAPDQKSTLKLLIETGHQISARTGPGE